MSEVCSTQASGRVVIQTLDKVRSNNNLMSNLDRGDYW